MARRALLTGPGGQHDRQEPCLRGSVRGTARSDHAAIMALQRAAGNAAVAELLSRAVGSAVQRQADAGRDGGTGVHAGRFSNSGTSELGRTLGPHTSGPYFVNGVEIVFAMDPGTRRRYRDLRPRQWSGPEAVYYKTGLPLGSPWRTMSRGNGSGADDPLPQSQRVNDREVVYDDSPGVSVLGHLGHTWVHAVQNFTGWIEGRSTRGGSTQRLTEVVAWHGIVSIINPDAASGGSRYEPFGLTGSGTGWVPTDAPNL